MTRKSDFLKFGQFYPRYSDNIVCCRGKFNEIVKNTPAGKVASYAISELSRSMR